MHKQSIKIVLSPKFFTAFLGTVVLLLVGCGNETEGQGGGFPTPEVSVAEVVMREVTPWEELSGRIEAKEIVDIRPRVGGVIEKIEYREGSTVKQDDLLFIIDPKPFRAELNRAEAELARARAQVALARADIRRAKNLVKRKLLSPGEYDQRVATQDQAAANMRSAQATANLARLNLGYTEVRSPIDGRTGRAQVTKGNLVASNTSLTTIRSLDPVYVIFDCDELTYLRYFGGLHQSPAADEATKHTVLVGLGNETGFHREGYVDFVDNKVDPGTGTIRIRAVLENKNDQLTPGLFARVKLLATKSQSEILINERAILTDQDRKYVYILGDENRAMRRDVKTGRNIGDLRIITEGLKAGDKLIVHGIQKVFFPNMPVKPLLIKMSDPPPVAGPQSKIEK